MSDANSTRPVLVGFDVGGTFTDVVVLDGSGSTFVEKVLTTPDDPARGARQGIDGALRRAGVSAGDVALIVHGTTLVTNAIIEGRGARTGLITTAGFEDTLDIGTGTRYDLYDLFLPFREPLVPRELRVGLTARHNAAGVQLSPLDGAEVARLVDTLVQRGCEAIAVCLLHSYRDPSHEQRTVEHIRYAAPQLAVCASSDLVAQIGEYERMSTTVANAYVQPLMRTYLTSIQSSFAAARLLLMGSNGGTLSVETAGKWPILLIESGPAAGALAAAAFAQRLGRRQVISFDMGGTTAKACLIDDYEPQRTPEFEAARAERFKPASGIPLRIQVVNLIEIGAGGGSLARVDELGLLKVGPQSASAQPGPACYGGGGTLPTVTDANLLLGFLASDSFLGGDLPLVDEAAAAAVDTVVAGPLQVSRTAAAWGIHDVVNEAMASAIRVHVAERNRDPRNYSMVAFGGAGPVHAVEVARKIGVREVIVPLGAGANSCFGLLGAPVAVDLVRSAPRLLPDVDWPSVHRVRRELADAARFEVASAGEGGRVGVRFFADARYVGQAHEITVELPSDGPLDEQVVAEAFHSVYSQRYATLNDTAEIEVTSWRLRAFGPSREIAHHPGHTAAGSSGPTAPREPRARSMWHPARSGFETVPVWRQQDLEPGREYPGPLLIEQRETTTVVGPRDRARVDVDRTLFVEVGCRE